MPIVSVLIILIVENGFIIVQWPIFVNRIFNK